MKTCKEKVQNDSEYMEKYYHTVDQLLDEGGLTLVSTPFLKWAKVLINAINININEDKIWNRRSTVVVDAVKVISKNPSLNKFFREALVGIPKVKEVVISTCHYELVLKAIHSRAGQVFKIFHEKFIGHYSKKINVAFRNALQCKAKDTKNKDREKTETKQDDDEN